MILWVLFADAANNAIERKSHLIPICRQRDKKITLVSLQAESTASVKVHLTSGPAQPSSSTVGPPPGFAPNSQLRRPKQPAIAGSQQSVSVKP